MILRTRVLAPFLLFAALTASNAATINFVVVDEVTNDAWRSSDIAKPDADGDNIYGTDGYFIAQYPNGNANNVSQPGYATLAANGQYEGVGAENHQSTFDDVVQTGPGVVPNLVAGDYWIENGAAENDFFTITLTQAASFRLGVIADQTPNLVGGPQTLWESSSAVRITGPGGLNTGFIDLLGPGEAWRDADVDYALFDITGDAGDVFTVIGQHDARWAANALGGVFVDTIPEPTVPLLAVLGLAGVVLRRRRTK